MKMRRSCVRALSAALAICASASAVAASKNPDASRATYKWVDDKGVIHYGDRVPPEYAKTERSMLNEQGVEIRRLEAEKSAEQRAADDRRMVELSAVKQRDQFLLTTYTSVADIESLRDQRVGEIADQTGSAEQYVATLNERLVALQARAQVFAPYNEAPDARRMPDELTGDLVRTMNELRTQRNVLIAKRTEQEAVMARFQSDIERYRDLTTRVARP